MHIEIIQTKNTLENVSTNLIKKLYELSYSDEYQNRILDNTSSLAGSLRAPSAYLEHVDYLNAEWPDLSVEAAKYYLLFKDPVMANILATLYGDRVGVTQLLMASVTDLQERFCAWRNLDYFSAESYDDMKYFTGVTSTKLFLSFLFPSSGDDIYARYGAVPSSYNPKDVLVLKKKSFTAPATTMTVPGNSGDNAALVRAENWARKVEFEHIDIRGLRTTGSDKPLFLYVDFRFEDLEFSTLREMNNPICASNSLLGKFIFPEGVTKVTDNFRSCEVTYIEYPTTLTHMGNTWLDFRRDGARNGCMVFKSVVPPLFNSPTTSNKDYCRFPATIYCPTNSVQAYRNWLTTIGYRNGTYPTITVESMLNMTSSELALGTVTQEDIDRT